MQLGRKRETVWLGLTSLGGDTKEEGISQAWVSSLGSKVLRPILDTSTLESDTRNRRPLSWFENQWSLLE